MDCNTTFATVDHGYLQIASGNLYQGEINSYNNWFTKFFAKLFGKSIDVFVGDKLRRLNKVSYIQFLNEHGIMATPWNLNTLKQFNNILYVRSDTKGPMRQHIGSAAKIASLTRKMVISIGSNDEVRATKYLGKGADVNQLFWIRGYDGKYVFEEHLSGGLPRAKIDPFSSDQLSPILFAAQHSLHTLVNHLLSFGALAAYIGHRYNFSREILSVANNTTLKPTVRPVVVVNNHPCCRSRVHVHHQFGLDLKTSQTITYRDTLQKTHDLMLDATYRFAPPILNAELPRTCDWSSTDVIGRTPLF